MAGTSHLGAGALAAPPPFLKRLLHASQRGRLTRLMVATDFSLSADLALARALRLPVGEGASLTLFHASLPVPGQGAPGDTALEGRCLSRVAGAARRRLRGRAPPVEVKEELRAGDVVEEAALAAQRQEAELVITGRPHVPRGHETAQRGAIVRGLVRRLEAPLLVVGAHPAHLYHRPLVAVDLSEDSRRALELTLRLCPPPVGVDVLHVPEACITPELWHAGMTSREHWLVVRQEVEAAARKAVSRFLAPYREAGRECEVSIRCGEPLEQALLAEAAERGSDLLALGMSASEGEAAPLRLPERMAMRTSCDVLVAKAHHL